MIVLQEGPGVDAASAPGASGVPATPPAPAVQDPTTATVFVGEGFELVLPAGWIADPPDAVAQLNEQAAQLGGPAAAGYLAAFRPGAEWSGWGALMQADAVPPFALVQVTGRDFSEMSPDQILAAVTRELSEGDGASFGEPRVADDASRVWFTGEAVLSEDAGGGTMAIATDGWIVPGRVVYLHRYADSRAVDASADAFETMTTTMTLTPVAGMDTSTTGGGLGWWTVPLIVGLGAIALVFVWKAARPAR